MLTELERFYADNYPNCGFSLTMNKVECMAHVLNLAAQEILKFFKLDVDAEYAENDSTMPPLARYPGYPTSCVKYDAVRC
jgi:hypothetical protein